MSNSNNRGNSATAWVVAALIAIIAVAFMVSSNDTPLTPPNAPAAAESRDGAGLPATSRNGNEPG